MDRVWFLALRKIYFNVADIYIWLSLEESGQSLVDQNHLVLASGRLLPYKKIGAADWTCNAFDVGLRANNQDLSSEGLG